MIIASVCRLGKNGANITIIYKGESSRSLTRVEGHLQLSLEQHRKCDDLCSIVNKYLILVKIQRFKFHMLDYCESILFIEKDRLLCPNYNY